MPTITFIQADGSRQQVAIKSGLTLMEGAVAAAVPGIIAECGGSCACSTCHCYVAETWFDKLPAALDDESGLLEFAWQPKPNSRLTCQIMVTDSLEGLELEVPAQQI